MSITEIVVMSIHFGQLSKTVSQAHPILNLKPSTSIAFNGNVSIGLNHCKQTSHVNIGNNSNIRSMVMEKSMSYISGHTDYEFIIHKQE